MLNRDLDKWRELRNNSVEVVLDKYATCMELTTLERIQYFESSSNVILPDEYKEFCLVFGEGVFGINRFSIECLPNFDLVNEDNTVEGTFISNKEILNCFKYDCQWKSEELALLDSALIFGNGYDKGSIFFFDLKTYSDKDRAYDIYGLFREDLLSPNGSIYFLGRSFFDFIHDVCIGNDALAKCPELLPQIGLDEDEEIEPEYWNRKTFIVHGGMLADYLSE